jgi:hypothetical protein
MLCIASHPQSMRCVRRRVRGRAGTARTYSRVRETVLASRPTTRGARARQHPDACATPRAPRPAIVIVEIILLALATTIRPTSMAAVLALLSINEPRRLMTVYVLVGLAFTVAFGLIAVFVVASTFSGIQINTGTDRTNGTAEILGGLVLIGLGIYVSQRRMKPDQADQIVRTPGRWTKLRERQLTPRTAALAGPATHIPGVFYLVALSLVVASEGSAASALVDVLIYNAVWFAVPILALAICVVDPAAARSAVGRIEDWTKLHMREIVLTVSLVVGAVLIFRGILAL